MVDDKLTSKKKKKKAKNKNKETEKEKEERKKRLDDIDESVIDNLILRIKLPQAIKVLTPVAIFVTMNHIYIFLEILGEKA